MTSSTRRLRRATQWLLGLACCLTLLSASAEEERPQVLFETNHGSFTVELYPHQAPASVENFLQLVADEFYTNLLFHRVIANFMVQTGGFDLDLVYQEPPRTVINEVIQRAAQPQRFHCHGAHWRPGFSRHPVLH